MLKLFVVLLGGRADGCNTELHDTVFVVGNSLEETYPKLVRKWFGNPKRLHIDSSIDLKYADGHEIRLSKDKPDSKLKLFFLNFGAYKPNYYGEVHEIGFYVGTTKTEVLAKAKRDLCLDLIEPHCDDNLPVDDIFSIENVDQYYIHLLPTEQEAPREIISDYRRLDLPENLEKAKALDE